MFFTFTNEELRNIGNKFKWFFENDNEDIEDNTIIKIGTAVKLVMTPNEIKLTEEIERLQKIINDLQHKSNDDSEDETIEDLDSDKTVDVDNPMALFSDAPTHIVVKEMKVIDDLFTNALSKVNKKNKIRCV